MVDYLPSKQKIWVRFPLPVRILPVPIVPRRSPPAYLVKLADTTDLSSVPFGYRFKSGSKHLVRTPRCSFPHPPYGGTCKVHIMGTRRLFAFKHCKRVAAPLWNALTPRHSVLLAKLQKTTRRRKQSSFATRLRLRRFVCLLYGNVSAHAFARSASRAAQGSTLFGQSLLAHMERRLDVASFRAGFAQSIPHARQGIGHGHFTVNGQVVHLPSVALADGDIFGCTAPSLKEGKDTQAVALPAHPPASHLEVSHTVRTAIFLFRPQAIFLPSFLDPKDLASLAP